MRKLTALSVMLIAAAGLHGRSSLADGCLEQVKQMASRYGVSDNPPKVTSSDSGTTTSDKLAKSGGVIEPPRVGDDNVITPRDTQAYKMPTVPEVAPKDKTTKGADRTALQAALTAARAQAERGNEDGCLEALAKAKSLAAKSE